MDGNVGGVSCIDADTRVSRTRYIDQRENINHIAAIEISPTMKGLKMSLI